MLGLGRPSVQQSCKSGKPEAPAVAAAECRHGADGTSRRAGSSNRRELLLMSTAAPALALALSAEVKAWQQELDLFSRRAQSALGLERPSPQQQLPLERPLLSPQFAQWLLDAPVQAARKLAEEGKLQWDEARYQAAFERFQAQELPYFKQAGTCGSCGAGNDLSDAAWVDFLSYIQFKALIAAQVRPAGSAAAADQAALMTGSSLNSQATDSSLGSIYDFMHRRSAELMEYEDDEASSSSGSSSSSSSMMALVKQRTGRMLLEKLEAAGPLAQAQAQGQGAGGLLSGAELALLAERSPQLDVIRAGVAALLAALKRAGFMAGAGIAFFGASKAEPRNHEVWSEEVREPAFLRIWLDTPLSLSSAAALQAEEGVTQDFMYELLAAYLARCGVSCQALKRFPSLSQPELESQQWLIQPAARSPEQPTPSQAALLQALPPYSLQECPLGVAC